MLETQEIKKATTENLLKELDKAQKQVVQTAMQVKTGQSKANHEINKLKKYIARTKTELRQRNTGKQALEKTAKTEENTPAVKS